MEKLTKRLIFIGVFTLLVLVGKQVNFAAMVGADNQFFTLFQFFEPTAGAILGPLFGAIAIAFAQLVDFVIQGREWDAINMIRLTPMLFAAYYFGTSKRNRISIGIPLLAIAAFIAHPVGREVWFFSLFWTIPIIARLLPERFSMSVPLKALGATFTAHAVGGVLWIWTVPMTAEQWIALIPIVMVERLLFAAGIAGSYLVLNLLLSKTLDALKVKIPADVLHLHKKFTLRV